jgi:hypothetical protein
MTTFQDPPPHSRRAVRQSERGETAQQSPTEQPAAPYTFDAASGAPAPADSAADQPAAAQPAAPASGRRAQARVPAPADAQAAQPLASSPPPMPGETPEQAAYRMRDYSPEGRRTADPSPMGGFDAPAAPASFDAGYPTQGAHSAGGSSLSLDDTLNHTLSRRELREMRAAAEAQAPTLQPPSSERPEPIDALLNSGPIDIPTLAPPPGQSQALAEAMAEFDMLTRSRREAEARARDAQVASLATPIVPQAPAAHHAAHSAQPDATADTSGQAQAPVQASPPQPPVQQLPFQQESVPQPPPAPAQYSVPSAPQAVPSAPQAVPSAPQPVAVQSAPVQQSVPQPPIAYPPTASLPMTPPVVESAPQASTPAPMLAPPNFDPEQAGPDTAPASAPASAPDTAPDTAAVNEQDPHGGRSPRASGHWRVQAAIEDDELPYENTLSRTVGPGTSAITTSALVLPSVPQPDLILNSLTSTGEIIVTGTIDLPRSLGSTGAHPSRVDNSDFEDDPLDSQVAAPDSAPIRAIRAISTNTSTRGVIEAKRPQGNRMLTAVIITASVLCVGLVGLLVYAIATNKL